MSRPIDADKLLEKQFFSLDDDGFGMMVVSVTDIISAPTVERKKGPYNAHEVAEILADAFGDTCACNFNGNDEWLPEKCELLDACPNPCGVACWEQYLKYRHCKNEMEAKEE